MVMDGMTSNDNVLEIAIANELGEIVGAAAKVDAFCEEQALSPEIAYAVNLSIDEILTNTISYGYDDDEPHRIEITMRRQGPALIIVIMDDSAPFDLSATPEADIDASLDEREVGGLGLFFVHQMMDNVAYERVDGRNVVTLTKSTAAAD